VTVQELIDSLSRFDKEGEVQILVKNDACDLCSHAKREVCSLEGEYRYTDFDISFKPDVLTIEVY
jgi:hypothetical protein